MLASWSLVGLPVLCMTGEVTHACLSDPGEPCDDGRGCCEDPCEVVTTRHDGRTQADVRPSVVPLPILIEADGEPSCESLSNPEGRPLTQKGRDLPYPPSDTPLRI